MHGQPVGLGIMPAAYLNFDLDWFAGNTRRGGAGNIFIARLVGAEHYIFSPGIDIKKTAAIRLFKNLFRLTEYFKDVAVGIFSVVRLWLPPFLIH